jgi:hypothetical protein
MPTGFTIEKRPGETRRIAADFSLSVLPGESLIPGNPTVTATDLILDGATPSFLSGAPALTGTTIVTQTVTGGSVGDVVSLLFRSGATTLGSLGYEIEANISVTDEPEAALIFASLDALKTKLGIASTDTSEDENLSMMLAGASAYFRQRTQRDLFFKAYQEEVLIEDCDEGSPTRVRLQHYPIRKVTKINLLRADGTLVEEISDSTRWNFRPEGDLWLHSGDVFFRFPDRNVVHYKAGYPKIPADIVRCVLDISTVLYRSGPRAGLSAEKIGQYSWSASTSDTMPFDSLFELADPMIEGVVQRYLRRDSD